jgi:glycosyltransferase involved in cell wall biosynthesis
MNVLFITLADINNLSEHGVYQDLLREFVKQGHQVFVVSPIEKRNKSCTELMQIDSTSILKVRTGNVTKSNLIEKGIATLLLETQFVRAIRKYFSNIQFDLALYSTPPVTFAKVIRFIIKRDRAISYLMLKDIFPQNAVDIGLLPSRGLIYRFFRKKEKALYAISDHIGCMSKANAQYILRHNPELNQKSVFELPNSITPCFIAMSDQERVQLREEYGFPMDKKILVYGGNLGKPQDIPFVIECLRQNMNMDDRHFVICGSGTEYHLLEHFIHIEKPKNIQLFPHLSKGEFSRMLCVCDVGLIFLDYRFTIPNFPSRLLSYMEAGLPVIACTDTATDIGKIIEDGGFGWWCGSNEPVKFTALVDHICAQDVSEKGALAQKYLMSHYLAEQSMSTILNYAQNG